MDKSKTGIKIFDKLANEYQDKFMDVSLYSDSFDLFCNSIVQENATILEIACGPGNITHYLLQKRPDFNILGIDLFPNMIELAKINNPKAAFQVMDCRDIGMIGKKYDGIMCGFCLPYLSREEAVTLISNASGLLKSGGILYVSTMEDDYCQSGFKTASSGDQVYTYYHQADYLTASLNENGFAIIDLQRKESPAPNGTNSKDLLIIAKRIV